MNITDLFLLLLLFQTKHFLADFVWQTEYMLGKFLKEGWKTPLLAHVAVHGVGTFFLAVFWINPWQALLLAIADMMSHFAIDRVKVLVSDGLTHQRKSFWVFIGIDQMLHHFVHYWIVAVIWGTVTTNWAF